MNFAATIANANPAHRRPIFVFPPPVPPADAPYKDFCDKGGRFGPRSVSQEIHSQPVDSQSGDPTARQADGHRYCALVANSQEKSPLSWPDCVGGSRLVQTPADEWQPMQLSVARICVEVAGLTGVVPLLSCEFQDDGLGV